MKKLRLLTIFLLFTGLAAWAQVRTLGEGTEIKVRTDTAIPAHPTSGAVYTATEGKIAADDPNTQLDWVRADFDGGRALLVPRLFDAGSSSLTLVTSRMVYRLRAFRDQGTAVWDIAVCNEVSHEATPSPCGMCCTPSAPCRPAS